MMDCNLQVKTRSLQGQTTRLQKEKVVPPKESTSLKLRDESRDRKPIEQTGSDHHSGRTRKNDSGGLLQSTPSGDYQKPWPSSKEVGVEELVKHMSNVPRYLQRVDGGDNVQHKALNFGVINWGRLEKWAYDQKQSPSTSDKSFSFGTFGSSIESSRSIGSPPAQRKRSPSFNGHWDPSFISCQTKMMEDDKSTSVMGFPDSRTSPTSSSIRYHQLSKTNCRNGTDHSGHQHGHGKGNDSDMKTTCYNMAQSPDTGSSAPISKDYETSDVAHNMVKVQDSRSREAEKSHSYEQQNCGSSLSFTRDSPQEQYLEFSQNMEDMLDHLQESVSGRCSSIESTTFDDRRPMEDYSFSVNLVHEDVQFTNSSPHVPHSCPLPSTDQSDEPETASTPLSEIGVPITKSKGKYEKHNQFIEEFVVTELESSGQDEAAGSTTTGSELSSNHCSSARLNRMKRSSSLREGSSVGQTKWTACPDNSHGDKATASNRGRHSPFRRLLDPLLNSKNHALFPGSIGPNKSSGATVNSCSSQAKENLNSSSQVSTSSHDSLQDKRHVPSNRQALLKVTWKNDTPLLVLSSDDSNILAATMKKKSISDKDNSECIYTILSIREVKKKSGFWINQGNKSKKNGSISNVVGQLKVSSSKLISSNSKGHFVVREFVLHGAEIIPSSHEPISSIFNSELAAILVKIPKKGPEGTLGDMLKSGNYWDSSQTNSAEDKSSGCQGGSLQVEQNPENLSLSCITALLLAKAHGLPATGEPSPLIERWKSGGICDCGGWDEGCVLTVLIDKDQESKRTGAVQAFLTMDGTDRIELFVQGRTVENRHAFSMVGCKEGLYTVEFSTSIALLQAFAICIATIYSRKPTNPSSVHDSVETKIFQEHVFANNMRAPATTHGGALTSYVPHHPPLSPVRRA